MWPAFWLLPQSGAWPPEIDVVELVDVMTASYHTLHYLSNGVHEVHRVSTTCLPSRSMCSSTSRSRAFSVRTGIAAAREHRAYVAARAV